MPAKKTQNKNLVNLLEDYWREIVKGIPETDESGSAANLKDADSLVSKWKNFGNRVLKATNAICVFNCRIPVVYLPYKSRDHHEKTSRTNKKYFRPGSLRICTRRKSCISGL